MRRRLLEEVISLGWLHGARDSRSYPSPSPANCCEQDKPNTACMNAQQQPSPDDRREP